MTTCRQLCRVSLALACLAGLIPPSIAAAQPAAGDAPLPQVVGFNRDVRPIFSGTCFACHGPDANTRKAKLRFDVREEAIKDRDGVKPIVPGNVEKSEAYQRIISKDADDQMPPADFHTQLTARDKAIIKKWIEQGAAYEKHWAFIAPTRPAAPKVKQADAVRNPIDAFVLARLEAQGLAFSPQADKATLIRRVTLDLTGLPPTPQDVEAFLADSAPDAYEKVVDRLLASKAYAEHMARYWLDAARYADTNGYQYDLGRQQWVWRDWVIHAFDANLPFDQFTIQQTAGDLMPNATDQTRLATGFHRNHPVTIEGGVIDEEYRTEYVMDRVVTTTTTWMGLTFICARCHDHKYDPIPQDDFYSFFAFFNSVPERGLNGFAPQMKIASPLQADQSKDLAARQAELERQLESAAPPALAGKWEAQLKAQLADEWRTIETAGLHAMHGSTLTRQADGSVLAGGKNPANEVYEITFILDRPTRALRLEALPDKSLVHGSTGRAANGNFVLTEFEVGVKAGDAYKPAKIAAASADYEQKGYPISATINGANAGGGWAIDGNTRFEAVSAVYTLAAPLAAGAAVRVRIVHQFGTSHSIGRFRLSAASRATEPTPADVRAALAVEPAKNRTPAQRAALTQYLVSQFAAGPAKAAAAELQAIRKQVESSNQNVPDTMVLAEMPKPRQTYVLSRGEYDKPINARPVLPNVPAVFGGLPKEAPRNRLGLAQWLVAKDNPLTARVTVNRFWAQLFGTGIVKTIEDFGSQGEYPSHPDLIDWLAVDFVESGWDVKHAMKTIVTSATYRQSSLVSPALHALDPENRLLARGPRFRLDAEAVRDSALAVSGLLDPTRGGPSVYPYQPGGLWMEINNRPGYSAEYPHTTDAAHLYRRSLYNYWKRTVPPPSMATFDAPEREYCVVRRSRTNTPLQAFVMLHDPQVVEASRHLAQRMIKAGGDADARLAHGFQLCTARKPTDAELAVLRQTLNERLVKYRSDKDAAMKVLSAGASKRDETIDVAEHAAYATVARLLLNLSEFVTKG